VEKRPTYLFISAFLVQRHNIFSSEDKSIIHFLNTCLFKNKFELIDDCCKIIEECFFEISLQFSGQEKCFLKSMVMIQKTMSRADGIVQKTMCCKHEI